MIDQSNRFFSFFIAHSENSDHSIRMTRFTNNFFFFFFVETILFIVVETTNSLLIVAELFVVVKYFSLSECFSKFCLIVKSFVDVVMKFSFFADDAATTEIFLCE